MLIRIFKSLKSRRSGTENYLLIVLLVKEVISLGCGDTWFGAKCQYKCGCDVLPCEANGECTGGGECTFGLFGPTCQYQDHAIVLTENTFLNDDDPTTCNTNTTSTSIVAEFQAGVLLTWFRLVVKNAGQIFNFTTRWNDGVKCLNERKYIVDSLTVDGTCENAIFVTKIRIEGGIVGSLCELHFSGGIRLGMKGRAYQSSQACEECSADNALDDRIYTFWNIVPCAITAKQIDSPEWFLVFDQQVRIHSVYIDSNNDSKILEDGYVVKLFTADGKEIELQRDPKEDHKGQSKFTLKGTHYHTNRIVKLSVSKVTNNLNEIRKQLILCEVYPFGAVVCPENTYGYLCTQCRCNITEVCNPYSGQCNAACPLGFYGENCLLKCSANCLDNFCFFKNGSCIGCKSDFSGDFCDVAKCLVGKTGQHCEEDCPLFCDGECDMLTGYCLKCVEGHIGSMCDECSNNFFGKFCEWECSVKCINRTCDSRTGKCIVPKIGLASKKNTEAKPVLWALASILLLSPFVLMIGSFLIEKYQEMTSLLTEVRKPSQAEGK